MREFNIDVEGSRHNEWQNGDVLFPQLVNIPSAEKIEAGDFKFSKVSLKWNVQMSSGKITDLVNGVVRLMLNDTDFLAVDDIRRYWFDDGRFTTHCFRRGGAQHLLMHRKIEAERMSLTQLKKWCCWSSSKGSKVLMAYLLNELSSREEESIADCRAPDFIRHGDWQKQHTTNGAPDPTPISDAQRIKAIEANVDEVKKVLGEMHSSLDYIKKRLFQLPSLASPATSSSSPPIPSPATESSSLPSPSETRPLKSEWPCQESWIGQLYVYNFADISRHVYIPLKNVRTKKVIHLKEDMKVPSCMSRAEEKKAIKNLRQKFALIKPISDFFCDFFLVHHQTVKDNSEILRLMSLDSLYGTDLDQMTELMDDFKEWLSSMDVHGQINLVSKACAVKLKKFQRHQIPPEDEDRTSGGAAGGNRAAKRRKTTDDSKASACSAVGGLIFDASILGRIMRNEMTIEETRKVDKWVTSTMAGIEDQQKEENGVEIKKKYGELQQQEQQQQEEEQVESDIRQRRQVLFSFPLPPATFDVIKLRANDVDRLKPLQYLNDNLVDFYLRWLLVVKYSHAFFIRHKIMIMSSHFFPHLANERVTCPKEQYDLVATWTVTSPIFDHEFVFIPIVKDQHWSLVILCHPSALICDVEVESKSPSSSNNDDDSIGMETKVPTMILLDSLGSYHDKKSLSKTLKNYLNQEWEAKGNYPIQNIDVEKLRTVIPRAPVQKNTSDCGVFMLQYVEHFIDQLTFGICEEETIVISQRSVDSELAHVFQPTSFTPEYVTDKRTTIKNLCDELIVDYNNYKGEVIDLEQEGKEETQNN